MNCLNQIIIEGKITKCCNVETLDSGIERLIFSIEVERKFANEAGEIAIETSYFDIAIYGRMVDLCSSRLKLGKGIRVVGRLKQEAIAVGSEVSNYVYVVGEHIEFKAL